MSEVLKNKMNGYQEVPPPSAWNRISSLLDEEFDRSDAILSNRLEQTSVPPPEGLWESISTGLHDEPVVKKHGKIIPLLYKRIAVAVIIAGALAVSVMYLFTGNGIHSSFIKGSASRNDSAMKYRPSTSANNPFVPSPATVIAQRPQARLLKVYNPPARKAGEENKSSEEELPDNQYTEANTESPYLPAAPADVQTVSALNPVNVAAPLLRDASGHVIMDMKLIAGNGNHFITVTSPNGIQTKLSSKFLPCLSYLNGDDTSQSLDEQGIECSEKFNEWRDKLLSQPAYVPTANNFFDIFELQDLIKD